MAFKCSKCGGAIEYKYGKCKGCTVEMLQKRINKLSFCDGWKADIDQIAYKLIPNEPRINIHNTMEHELAKAKICYLAKKQGELVYCEVIFLKGGRCDIYMPHRNQIIEILHSEKLVDAKKKEEYYPKSNTISYVESSEVLKNGYKI